MGVVLDLLAALLEIVDAQNFDFDAIDEEDGCREGVGHDACQAD